LRRLRARRPTRLGCEQLEDRTLLDSSPALVVGRTLSSYFVGNVQNNQETVTYTVYNQQSDAETGVLLTTTLENGVSVRSASPQPDQSGQDLAWSLGTIAGNERASVTVTLLLPSPTPTQLDTGAQTFATLDGGTVSASTPAAVLSTATPPDPSLVASTPDANTTDPYVQEEAAQLDYDPTQIFNFLHTQIGYQAYAGSIRGARGTLWSGSGNDLDIASLGVALMRASGIPAQYAGGTLSAEQAQALVLSMFSASTQTVGYVPAGAQTADPANNYTLIDEAINHYWFQFNTGSGMQNADPLLPGAMIGQTFPNVTASTTFAAVPSDLEETTQIQLVAEIYSQADASFGLNPLQDTTVISQTFDDAQLVGRPLTIGFDVSQNLLGAAPFSQVTNTYTPYLVLGDEAFPDPSQSNVTVGQSYQENLTNFPLGNQILTGLFLNINLSGPDGQAESYQRTLVDRIGYGVRQGLRSPSVSVNPTAPPIVSPTDMYTLNVLPGVQSAAAIGPLYDAAHQDESALSQLGSATVATAAPPTISLETSLITAAQELKIAQFLVASAELTASYASLSDVVAYYDRPRITIVSEQGDPGLGTIDYAIDLRRETMSVYAAPGQNTAAAQGFDLARGLADNALESDLIPALQNGVNIGTESIFQQAAAQGIPILVITSENLDLVSSLNISSDAQAYITTAVQSGLEVLVPAHEVSIGGTTTISWFEINPTTGETVGVLENGIHSTDFLEAAGVDASDSVLVDDLYAQINAKNPFLLNPTPGVPQALPVEVNAPSDILSLLIPYATPVTGVISADAILVARSILQILFGDPPLPDSLLNLVPLAAANQVVGTVSEAALAVAGVVQATVQAPSAALSGQITASWNSTSSSRFSAASLSAPNAIVTDSKGNAIGSGAVALQASGQPLSVSGTVSYGVSGAGNLSFYGPAETTLGVSGTWTSYTATATGTVAIALTTSALSLNGQTLPAGTYTITTSAATLTGSGATSAPNFAGAATVNLTGGTINLGPGTGNLSVGGTSRTAGAQTTLDGYSGTLTVTANGAGTDAVNLNGAATNVLQVTVASAPFTTDQNTPITFQPSIETSLAETYNLTVKAPPGWTVAIDAKGNVTVTSASGVQSGTFPIQIIAQSQTDANLVAETTVEVMIAATQPGITLSVTPDTVLTVPFDGADLPTAFRVAVTNLGPAADTYDLTFSNPPTGFSYEQTAASLMVPAGATGIAGVYLVPTGQIPEQGTAANFSVTAASTTSASLTQTETENFTIPAIDAVTVTSNPAAVNTAPGAAGDDTIRLSDVGNQSETVTLSAVTSTTGLTVSGLSPVALLPGQSSTTSITLTPDASTPLNSLLQATLTATFGPAAAPVTQTLTIPVSVMVPGASTVAGAADTASLVGNTGLGSILRDFGTALTNLAQNPADPVSAGQVQADLTSIISQVSNDPFLSGFTAAFTTAQTALAATTAGTVQAAITSLGRALSSFAGTISDEAAHGFTLNLTPSVTIVLPGAPEVFALVMTNHGTAASTYDLAVSPLPAGVTAAFSQPSVTLQPGASIGAGTGAVTLTLTESGTTLIPASFTVTATAEEASEITTGTPGQVTLRRVDHRCRRHRHPTLHPARWPRRRLGAGAGRGQRAAGAHGVVHCHR
jgi:transglutaminase-like putative cysteine protease